MANGSLNQSPCRRKPFLNKEKNYFALYFLEALFLLQSIRSLASPDPPTLTFVNKSKSKRGEPPLPATMRCYQHPITTFTTDILQEYRS